MGSISEKLFIRPSGKDQIIRISDYATFDVYAQDCYTGEAEQEQLVGEKRPAFITAQQRTKMLDALHIHVINSGAELIDRRIDNAELEGGEVGKSLWLRMPFKVHKTGAEWMDASREFREEQDDQVAEGVFELVTTCSSLKAMGLEVFSRALTDSEKRDAGSHIINFLSSSGPGEIAHYVNGSDRRATLLADGSGEIRIGCLLPEQLKKDPARRLKVDVALIMRYTRGLIHVIQDILSLQLEFQEAEQAVLRR